MTTKEKEIREFLGDFKVVHIDEATNRTQEFDVVRFRKLASEVNKIYSDKDEDNENKNSNNRESS